VRVALAALASVWAAAGAPPASADIYKYVDAQGVVHLADRRLHSGYKLLMRTAKRSSPSAASAALAQNRRRFASLIDATAQRYRLPAELVHAVVIAESAYDPHAISKKGAVGLMQLMPETARRYGVRDRRDPAENLTGGVRYLRDLLLQFRNLTLALAAYNAGENAVIRYGNRIPPFPETQAYVRKVLAYYRRLKQPT